MYELPDRGRRTSDGKHRHSIEFNKPSSLRTITSESEILPDNILGFRLYREQRIASVHVCARYEWLFVAIVDTSFDVFALCLCRWLLMRCWLRLRNLTHLIDWVF